MGGTLKQSYILWSSIDFDSIADWPTTAKNIHDAQVQRFELAPQVSKSFTTHASSTPIRMRLKRVNQIAINNSC